MLSSCLVLSELGGTKLQSTSFQQSPHSTKGPHFAHCEEVECWLLEHITHINTLSTICPHFAHSSGVVMMIDAKHVSKQHILNIFSSSCPLRKRGAGLYVGCLCIRYWQDVGVMLSLSPWIPHILSVLPKISSTGQKCFNFLLNFQI